MKTDPKARYQGYTFYFREGFCWNNVLNPNARLLKVRLKKSSVNDVGAMSLYPIGNYIDSNYCIALLNSNLLFDFYREFINCTVNIQMNDLRQLPIIIPSKEILSQINSFVEQAIKLKQIQYENDKALKEIEAKIDKIVYSLYQI